MSSTSFWPYLEILDGGIVVAHVLVSQLGEASPEVVEDLLQLELPHLRGTCARGGVEWGGVRRRRRIPTPTRR